MLVGVKQDRFSHQKGLHSAVWPGVLARIKECNIQNYFIYWQ
jgi:L-rhamnose mutarotase